MREVIVIGGGASGLMAALTAARRGADVLLLEKMNRPGKKLLMTGNGRCNLTNLDPHLPQAYHSSDPEALSRIWRFLEPDLGQRETLRTFAGLGLLCHDRDGFVYPRSDQASRVLEVLLEELERLKVRLKFSSPVKRLYRKDGIWQAETGEWTYEARRVILACGSLAASATGSDGSGYALAGALGHRVIPPAPALTALTVEDPALKKAAGARTEALVTLVLEGERVRQEEGQIQWTQEGLSGIVIFQLCRFVSRALIDRGGSAKPRLFLDLVPGMSQESLMGYFCRLAADRGYPKEVSAWRSEQIKALLGSCVPDRVSELIGDRFRLSPGGRDGTGGAGVLAHLLKELSFDVTGTRSFDSAQVCAGGIDLSQVHPDTLESTICPGLYFAGEILDADGPCGGYNLQWAWSTGQLAGLSAAQKAGEKRR